MSPIALDSHLYHLNFYRLSFYIQSCCGIDFKLVIFGDKSLDDNKVKMQNIVYFVSAIV